MTFKQSYRLRIGILAAVLLVGGAVWAALQPAGSSDDLAAWVPQGALLSIESRDFSALLHEWSASPESAAWLKSDNYAIFSRSHLFGRLQDAQKEFANAAGVPVDNDFLKNIAGAETLFAWYDIGSLQVVYLTRMTPGMAERNQLLTHRKQFETRQAGGITFYVKTSSGASSNTALSANAAVKDTANTDASDADTDTSPGRSLTSENRTVAFAVSGDWLILSTGEDLMAQTLELMAAKGHVPGNALSQQAWYAEAKSKAPARAGDLRMVLNLKDIVKTPAFRTYWIQRNITAMKSYRAAVSDLTRDADGLREDRVLLPVENLSNVDTDLGTLASMAPEHTVIYHAVAAPTEAQATESLQEKVLDHSLSTLEDPRFAPTAALDPPQAGSTIDLETRIDEPTAGTPKLNDNAALLHMGLHGASLQAMMTLDTHRMTAQPGEIWTPFSSAVILQSTQDWNASAIRDAIRLHIQQSLTAGGLGTEWQARKSQGIDYFAMSDTDGLAIAFRGHLCVIADDATLLVNILKTPRPPGNKAQLAGLISAFDHDAAAKPFARWTGIVDGQHPAVPQQIPNGTAPSFFSGDLKSLSDSFAGFKSETFVERHNGDLIDQTLRYSRE